MGATTIRMAIAAAACSTILRVALPADAAGPKGSPRAVADGPFGTGPEVWDANGDGVFTCDEWKSYLERWFAVADRNRDGRLDQAEFAALRRPNTLFAEADFGYFDENQDGRISHAEFVGKPSEFILQHDKNGDCRVTSEEMKPGEKCGPESPGRPRQGALSRAARHPCDGAVRMGWRRARRGVNRPLSPCGSGDRR